MERLDEERGIEKTAVEMLKKHASIDFIKDLTGFNKEKFDDLAKRFNILPESNAH